MTAADAVDAHRQTGIRTLSIREAAGATGTNSRSIRRRLAAGAFPGAYKATDPQQPDTMVWRIPIDDLEAAGLGPVDLADTDAPEISDSIVTALAPTAANLIGTDRFARLRSELAEAVASAELALLRAEAEKWRAVADERGHALERADVALHSLTAALSQPSAPPPAQPGPAPADAPPALERADSAAPGSPTAVPSHIRNEAVLYAESMSARRRRNSDSARSSWWRRRR